MNYLNKLKQKESFWALIMLMPALLGTLIFIIIPVIGSFAISLTSWNLISPPKFVGIHNYVKLLSDSLFYEVLYTTSIYAIAVVIFSITIPMVLAVALNEKLKGLILFRTAYFLPVITPMIVAAIVWSWIFDPSNGILNFLLNTIGINDTPKWLFDKNWALISIIIVSVWKNIGYNMVIFLAGLQGIPDTLYEAAEIDGANPIKKFWHITIPMLTPTIFFVCIMSTISAFQVFDLIYLMTSGGPENSTMVIVYWLFKNAFEFFKIGYASSIAYVLFIIILILTLIQWKLRKKWVMFE
ncbi:MAG: carbohydrate ABC transporter permease [Vampirovibrionia bacterium]